MDEVKLQLEPEDYTESQGRHTYRRLVLIRLTVKTILNGGTGKSLKNLGELSLNIISSTMQILMQNQYFLSLKDPK